MTPDDVPAVAGRPGRTLRPGLLVPVGDHIWVLDEVQPVAVVLDARTGGRLATVGWPEVPPAPRPSWRETWQVRPAADGLWVQQPGGPLALVTGAGLRSGHLTAGLTLGAVSAHGAWCLPDPPAQRIVSTPDAPPPPAGGVDLLVAHPGRTTAEVHVDAPVRAARSHDGDLYLAVETGRWGPHSLGAPDAWELVPETAWLRLAGPQPLPTRLGLASHASDPPPGGYRAEPDGGRRTASPWLQLPGGGTSRMRSWATGATGGGRVRWYAGWDRTHPGRQVVAVAWDAGTDAELFRVSLGQGAVRAMTATTDSAWLAVEGLRHFATYSRPAPTRLVRVRAADGRVEEVLPAGSVDVGEHCWPLPAEPIDATDYSGYWRDRTRRSLPREALDGRVEVVGSWPDTELHVTFAADRRPGVRLRRVLPLFDELGRQAAPEYAGIHLMEDLATSGVPDGPAPESGYLDY